MPAGESPRHATLKRLALCWAQQRGFRVAAAEVSIPQFGFRLDAAAYRPATAPQLDAKTQRLRRRPCLGATAIFECKQTRADFRRDSHRAELLAQRLAKLHARRALYEESMPRHFPSLRNGESLFPEFDGYRFEAAGFEPYDKLMREIRALAIRLHEQTKFDKLLRWRAANLCYVVAEEDVAAPHELPPGWGLLVRCDSVLRVQAEAQWGETSEEQCLNLLVRIALSGTRATNREFGIEMAALFGGASARLPLSC